MLISVTEARATMYGSCLLTALSSVKDDLKPLTREADELAPILRAIVVRTKSLRTET
jgi:hypothetical protein